MSLTLMLQGLHSCRVSLSDSATHPPKKFLSARGAAGVAGNGVTAGEDHHAPDYPRARWQDLFWAMALRDCWEMRVGNPGQNPVSCAGRSLPGARDSDRASSHAVRKTRTRHRHGALSRRHITGEPETWRPA